MVVRTRSSSRCVENNDDGSQPNNIVQQQSTQQQTDLDDTSSTLSDVPASINSDSLSEVNDQPSNITAATDAAPSPEIQQQSEPTATTALHIIQQGVGDLKTDQAKHATPPHRDRVELKASKPSPLNSPIISPRQLYKEEEEVTFFEQGDIASKANSGTTTPGSVIDYELTEDDSSYHGPTGEGAFGDKSTSEISTANGGKDEDLELEGLVKRVKVIVHDWRSLKIPLQAPPERRRSVYFPSDYTKALARKVTGMEISAEAEAMLSANGVDQLGEPHVAPLYEERQTSPKSKLANSIPMNDVISSSPTATSEKMEQEGNTQSSTIFSDEGTQTIIPELFTKVEAQALSSSPTQTLNMEEFEEESSKRRAEARAQTGIAEAVEYDHKSTISPSQEVNSETDGRTKVDSPRQDIHMHETTKEAVVAPVIPAGMPSQDPVQQPKKAPNLADRIVEAVTKSNRKTHVEGDVAIIVDADDLSKTILLPSNLSLFREMDFLQDYKASSTAPAHNELAKGMKSIVILETNGNLSNMPVLTPVESHDIEKGDISKYKPYFQLLKTTKEIKSEPEHSESHGAPTRTLPRVDWIKSYDAFLSIATKPNDLSNKPINSLMNLLNNDAGSALPQIEGVLEIAARFNWVSRISPNLKLVIHEYQGNSTLYDAIAAEAASWLLIGNKIQDDSVFKEAFCHVAGCYPDWPWQRPMVDIPEIILSRIKSKSRDLAIFQREVQVKLSRIFLSVKQNKRDRQPLPVSQWNGAHSYDVLNFWWQWVAGHFAYLETNDNRNESQDSRDAGEKTATTCPSQTDFCDHKSGECLNVAKLYRALAKGGDAYLPYDQMTKKWNEEEYGKDEEAMRDALDTLKREALKIVAPLVKSPLYYQQSDKLGYLTCITVKDEDMPWKNEEEDKEV